MASILNSFVYFLIGTVSGPIILAILFILSTAIYIYVTEIWWTMVTHRKRYLEWNKCRKEWNKAFVIEKRRRFIMACFVFREVRRQGLSEEVHFYYEELVRDLLVFKNIIC
jgi:hypothetical protein